MQPSKQADTGTKTMESGCPMWTPAVRTRNVEKQRRRLKEWWSKQEKRIELKRIRWGAMTEERQTNGRKKGRNSADCLAVLGQAEHTSPVTRDWGRHVSSQIAPQTNWQELSAEKGEGLFLACSHARVNHWQLQRGGAIKRPWCCSTEVCGLRFTRVSSTTAIQTTHFWKT